MREAKLTRRQRKREWPYMTIDSRSVSCTWIHWCPIVYPLSVISFVFEDTFWRTKGNQKDISRRAWQLFGFYIIRVITIMIENYTMGPNSTSLFILTLRESYKLSDSRVILYLLLPSILDHPLPIHRRINEHTSVLCYEVYLKIYGRLKAGIFIFIF